MNITYQCPNCQLADRTFFESTSDAITCSHCQRKIVVPSDAVIDHRIERCLVCPSHDLYTRKDFPQRVGVALVGIGIVGSSIAWAYSLLYWTFGILLGTAFIDLVLYMLVGDALMCYRCEAQYRGTNIDAQDRPFDLETHERYRQLAARVDSSASHVDSSASHVDSSASHVDSSASHVDSSASPDAPSPELESAIDKVNPSRSPPAEELKSSTP